MADRPAGDASPADAVSDAALLALLAERPAEAWQLFLDRHADFVLTELHRLGLGRDAALDGFVYVCEKLAEDDFRRLRTIRHTGAHDDLRPWLRAVVKNLATNWRWSREGRRRLLRAVERLPALEQRVFQLYFWRGMRPSELIEQLGREGGGPPSPIAVFDALETVFAQLSASRLWHLVAGLAQRRAQAQADAPEIGRGPSEPASPDGDPEQHALRRETTQRVQRGLQTLAPRTRLALRMRYDDHLSVPEIADIIDLSPRQVHRLLGDAREHLRRLLGEEGDAEERP